MNGSTEEIPQPVNGFYKTGANQKIHSGTVVGWDFKF
jgi:hypothetical protein